MERLSQVHKPTKGGYVFTTYWYGILGEKGARVPEHRLIAAMMLGRRLEDGEMVHHLDLDKSNNSPDNLVVVNSSEHGEFHRNGNFARRQQPKRPLHFAGKTAYVKMKCPWCGKVFYKLRSSSVLEHDNKLHVNCCSSKCSNRLYDSVESGTCSDLGKRVRDNIICEFKSNGPFMKRLAAGKLPSQWFIDDNGVFHGDC